LEVFVLRVSNSRRMIQDKLNKSNLKFEPWVSIFDFFAEPTDFHFSFHVPSFHVRLAGIPG